VESSLERIDERTLFQAIRLGITSGASRMHFRPGCAPLCTWHGGEQHLRYRQLTSEDTEAIAGFLLEHAHVPEPYVAEPCEAARPLALLCELPGEALLQVRLARETSGVLSIAVDIARPVDFTSF
jgi:hypothetical protein